MADTVLTHSAHFHNVEVTGHLNTKKPVSVVTNVPNNTLNLTEEHSGGVFFLNRAAGLTVNLPVCAEGTEFTFIIGDTFTGTLSIDAANANDIFTASSNLLIWDKDAPAPVSAKQFYADGTDDDKIVMDTDTKGRFIGGKINIIGIADGGQNAATQVWHTDGMVYGDGVLANPFA